jgi:Na+(H+)/acetate symporter ActP
MLKFKFGLLMVEKMLLLVKESWWFGISPEGFGTIAMIVNFVVAFTVKSFTPEPPKMFKILWSTLDSFWCRRSNTLKVVN